MITDQDISNLSDVFTLAIRERAKYRKEVFNMITFEAELVDKINKMNEELTKLKKK